MKLLIKLFLVAAIFFVSAVSAHAQNTELANGYLTKAKALEKVGKYLEAAKIFVKSAEAERAGPRPRLKDLSADLSIAGINYYRIGQYDKATEYYQQGLEIGRQIGDKAGITTGINNMGFVYIYQKEYPAAIKHFEQSVALIEKLRKTASGDVRRDYLASAIRYLPGVNFFLYSRWANFKGI